MLIKKCKSNLTVSELYFDSVKYENMQISSTGALLAYSGKNTGRCPQDKRIVKDSKTSHIWWGDVNIPIDPILYNVYKSESINYLSQCKYIYRIDAYAGWDNNNQIKVTLYTTNPYHALFIKNLLIPSEIEFEKADFIIYDSSERLLSSVPIPSEVTPDLKLKDTLVALNFTSMDMVIYGTEYAGEIKKGIFTLMMYLMPIKGHLPLHSSANIDGDNLCLFFGLSGTGKTTLSADNNRELIGDDEHVWTDNGIFNIEGGCYAKCINLRKEYEPEIYNAIRYGAVLENVIYNNKSEVQYENSSITENTRCAYPLNYIPNAVIPASVKMHPMNIIFLMCDSFGLLPPVAKLSHSQAYDFFTAGYTSKIAGTEIGIKEPVATFSSCFGEPFIVWHPSRYGKILQEKLAQHNSNVWILNTGWINGPYGTGDRISILLTRKLLNAIHDGSLIKQEFIEYPIFNFEIPTSYPGIDSAIFDPRKNYPDQSSYMDKLQNLHLMFGEKIRNL